MEKGLVVVHIGAGYHSTVFRNDYKKVMKQACKKAVEGLKNGQSSLDVVCSAITVLENSSLTNAAIGSSLTMNGKVECDAGIMEGKSLDQGFVGAVPGVKNPILLAQKILLEQNNPLPAGLIPPSLLTGIGAHQFAKDNDITVCPTKHLITERSRRTYDSAIKTYKADQRRMQKDEIDKVDMSNLEEPLSPGKRPKIEEEQPPKKVTHTVLDTVGCIVLDSNGGVSAGVSSGGILLKREGRVGHAAIPGAGCWAQCDLKGSGTDVCVSASGCGEHLNKTSFAVNMAGSLATTDDLGQQLNEDVKRMFLESPFLRKVDLRMCGAIGLRSQKDEIDRCNVDLFWLHSTNSFGLAYQAVTDVKAQALFSDLEESRVGLTLALGCKSFSFANRQTNSEENKQE